MFAKPETITLIKSGLDPEVIVSLPSFDLGTYKLEPAEQLFLQQSIPRMSEKGCCGPSTEISLHTYPHCLRN